MQRGSKESPLVWAGLRGPQCSGVFSLQAECVPWESGKKPSHNTSLCCAAPGPSLRVQPTSWPLNHSPPRAAGCCLSQWREGGLPGSISSPPLPSPPLPSSVEVLPFRGSEEMCVCCLPFTSSLLSAAFTYLRRPLFLSHPFSELTTPSGTHQALSAILDVFLQKTLGKR